MVLTPVRRLPGSGFLHFVGLGTTRHTRLEVGVVGLDEVTVCSEYHSAPSACRFFVASVLCYGRRAGRRRRGGGGGGGVPRLEAACDRSEQWWCEVLQIGNVGMSSEKGWVGVSECHIARGVDARGSSSE